jgi:hypothetical protein
MTRLIVALALALRFVQTVHRQSALRMKCRPVLLLSSLALFSSFNPSGSDAAPSTLPVNRPITSAITAHGVRLSLSLPRSTYPHNALVRVRLTLTNLSRHTIYVGSTAAPACAWYGPGVQVLGSSGQVLYPPATEWLLASCGPPILSRPLEPGRALRRTTFAILWGTAIRGVATLSTATLRKAVTIESPLLYPHMIDEAAPSLTLKRQPGLQLTVAPAVPEQHGVFSFVFGVWCPGPNPPSLEGGHATGVSRWQRAPTLLGRPFHLEAQCANPVRWVFAGGWLNHPVAAVDYRGSG